MSVWLLTVLTIFILAEVTLHAQTAVQYESSDEIIFNPERGFYAYSQSRLTNSFINNLKAQKVSVIQRNYIIPQYNNVPLSQNFLELFASDLNTARAGGVKLNTRFFYTDKQSGQDAALDTILLHISQIKPILQDNYDVIAYMDAGFIGAWGEWYYSTHGLNNTNARREVLFALLDALPVQRCVLVRTPDYKRRIFEYNEPLTFEEAFSGIRRARTGAHNDCFLASETDYGTYLYNDIEGDKDYLNSDNRFVPQTGETCCDCGWAGCDNALADLERMHWSVLNKDYNLDVLNRWVDEGCMDEIKRRLGYRFVLLDALISDTIKPGGEFNINFRIFNEGFASPYNPRNLEIILRDSVTNYKYRIISSEDPRLWMSGDTAVVDISAGIPVNMPEGRYYAYLFLADPAPGIHDRPEYSIRLANQDIWEDSTGYNYLKHKITVSQDASGDSYTGELFFESYSNTVSVDDEPVNIQNRDEKTEIPDVYPNPFNSSVVIKFNTNQNNIKGVDIYNILGKKIKSFDNSQISGGSVLWNATDNSERKVPSGIYILQLTTDNGIYSKKLVLLK